MCNECCKELRGWCGSFTRTETALALLEAVLLVLCVASLVFLVGHFIVCGAPHLEDSTAKPITETVIAATTSSWSRPTAPSSYSTDGTERHTTLASDIECTWTPSVKTEPTARYYEGIATASVATNSTTSTTPRPDSASSGSDQWEDVKAPTDLAAIVLALVRRRGGGEPVFGCALTALSEHWALTAASCLDAVEETDTLDQYLMLERWGAGDARAHAVADVRVHPRYSVQPAVHDAAALRSPDPLLRGAAPPRLPAVTDHYLITIGERFTILGFGPFRCTSKSGERTLRAVSVYSMSSSKCSAASDGDDGWAARHLGERGQRVHAACSHNALCAGVLSADTSGASCGYCAGTPLLRARTLLAVAAAAPCGENCQPAPYVSVALIRQWIDELLRYD